jgi:hypothetical protein
VEETLTSQMIHALHLPSALHCRSTNAGVNVMMIIHLFSDGNSVPMAHTRRLQTM